MGRHTSLVEPDDGLLSTWTSSGPYMPRAFSAQHRLWYSEWLSDHPIPLFPSFPGIALSSLEPLVLSLTRDQPLPSSITGKVQPPLYPPDLISFLSIPGSVYNDWPNINYRAIKVDV